MSRTSVGKWGVRMGIIKLIHWPVWQLMLTVGWRLSAKMPLLTWLLMQPGFLKLGSQAQEQMFWGRGPSQSHSVFATWPQKSQNHLCHVLLVKAVAKVHPGLREETRLHLSMKECQHHIVSRACGMALSWVAIFEKCSMPQAVMGKRPKFL